MLPLRVGLTGGIGAGKSLIARIFESLGVPVFDSDKVSKSILADNLEVKEQVISVFGNEAYNGNELNKSYLAGRVFSNYSLREKLNSIVHPAVATAFEEWVREHSKEPYVLKEAAIIFETGLHEKLDAVILITAPEQIRIDRVMKRDDVSVNQVRQRMAAQWTDQQKQGLTDYTILNDGTSLVIPQVLHIHNTLKSGVLTKSN